jgi:hypothetical protein
MFARLGAPALNQWLRERIPTIAMTAAPSAPRAGEPIMLIAAASAPPSQQGGASYTWDLDNDGAFDDGYGPGVTVTSVLAGTHPYRVQAVYPDGDRAVTREVVTVAAAPPPPPAARTPRLVGVPRRVRTRALLDRRISFRVRCYSPCSVQGRLRFVNSRHSTQVGAGSARTEQPAALRLTIKLTRTGVRRLRRLRGGTLELRATVKEANRSTRLKKRVTLRR